MRIALIKPTKENQPRPRIIFPEIRMKVATGLGLRIAHPAISPIPLPFGLGINEVNLFVFDLVSPLLENRLGQLSIAHGTKVP